MHMLIIQRFHVSGALQSVVGETFGRDHSTTCRLIRPSVEGAADADFAVDLSTFRAQTEEADALKIYFCNLALSLINVRGFSLVCE